MIAETKVMLENCCKTILDTYNNTSKSIYDIPIEKFLLNNYFTMKYHPLVYFIRNDYTGMIKIGSTKNLITRFKDIQSSFISLGFKPQKLRLIGIHICPWINYGRYKPQLMHEKEWHNYFSKYTHIGEWYNIPESDLLENLEYYNEGAYYFMHKGVAIQKAELFYFNKNNELIDTLNIYYNNLFGSAEFLLKYIQSDFKTVMPITQERNLVELISFMQTLSENQNPDTLYTLYQNKAKQLIDYFSDNFIV